MRDLVFVKFNSKLRNKKENKGRDPLEKEIDDIVGDNDNEFITGIAPFPSELPEQGDSSSQAKAQPKRKRFVRPRKKKVRSLQSLMRDDPEPSSSESEDGDGDVSMQSSDSDKSPYVSDSE
ncbi:unnamed protein product [Urochloa humidicola]